MACGTCGSSSVAMGNTQQVSPNYKVEQNIGPCDYTNEILNVWLDKLKWFKDRGLHVKNNVPPAKINKYLGIVLTSINVNNKCVYKSTLDEIANLITLINGLQ